MSGRNVKKGEGSGVHPKEKKDSKKENKENKKEKRSEKPTNVNTEDDPRVLFHEAEDPVHGEPQDVAKLIYSNYEVEVKRYREKPTREIRHLRVTKVISPYLFYTEFDMDKGCRGYRDWRDAMQELYNDPSTRNTFKVRTTILLKYRCYAYHDPQTKRWERVRVMKYDVQNHVAEIYMYEHNEFRIVPREDIWELQPELAVWGAQTFPCHLVHVKPRDSSAFWSKEAVDYFKQLVEGKTFIAVALARTTLPFPEGFPEVIDFHSICMVQKEPRKDITVQAELVKAGFAQPTGFIAGWDGMFDPYFDATGRFILEDFSKAVHALGVKDPSVLTPDYVRTYLDKLLATATLQKDNSNANAQVRTDGPLEFNPDTFKRWKPPNNEETFEHLPYVYKKACSQIRFSHIVSPGILYVQFENRVDELRELETALGLMVQDNKPLPCREEQVGSFIACLCPVDRFREPTWVRAVVRQVIPNLKLFRIVLLDYGSETSIKDKFTRALPKYFKDIPSFTLRVHLASPRLVPGGGRQWTADAAETFSRYMSAWNQHIPIYYGWKPLNEGVVKLQDFNQEVAWNHSEHCWVPARRSHHNTAGDTLNNMSEHMLIKSLYTSVGMDILYEIINRIPGSTDDYKFESLAETLIDCGYGLRLAPVKTLKGEHFAIVAATSDDEYLHKQMLINNQKQNPQK